MNFLVLGDIFPSALSLLKKKIPVLIKKNKIDPKNCRIIHGTTLVANALIERKGVKTALLTTQGFKDVLEIGREWRYDLFSLDLEMPSPIVPRHLRFEIEERQGNVNFPFPPAIGNG